jgi:hypothetical protein
MIHHDRDKEIIDMTMNTNANATTTNRLMDTLARWQRATEWLGACGIDAKKLGSEVAAALEVHACAVVRDDLAALVAVLEAVRGILEAADGIRGSLPTTVPAPRAVMTPVVAAPIATVATAPAPLAAAPASSTPIAPATPSEIEEAFAAQITGSRTLRELATLGVKVGRSGLPKEATDRLQVAYQARKAGLGGGAPKAPAGAPVVPRGGVAAPVAPPMPPAAVAPASGPVAAPGGGVVAVAAMPTAHPWVAARFFAGGGRQILGYVSAATNQAAIDAAEAKWGVGGGVGVMDLALCSALELAEADKAVGRAAPTGVAVAAGNGGGKKIQVEMPEGFTPDPDADAQEGDA